MKRRKLAEEWNSYSSEVLEPLGFGAAQRDEMRRAFYCGAAAYNSLLCDIDPETAAGLKGIDDLESELTDFGEELKRGAMGQ